jgi:hypothetical protein
MFTRLAIMMISEGQMKRCLFFLSTQKDSSKAIKGIEA